MRVRKKPMRVEAEQFRADQPLPFRDHGVVLFGCPCDANSACTLCGRFWVQTLEGPLVVSDGDWIIRGVKGEFYPCKPDVFELTYERVDDDEKE
jgi:hypothetical protein